MREAITKLKDSRRFLEAFSNTDADQDATRALMQRLVAEKEGYETKLRSRDALLAMDQHRNVKVLERFWDPFRGHHVKEWTLNADEITKIKIATSPGVLAPSLGKFALGGGLAGGLGGAIIGAVVDEITGPKREDVWVWFEFHTEDSYPYACRYEAFSQKKVPMVESGIDYVSKKISGPLRKIRDLFPGKLES